MTDEQLEQALAALRQWVAEREGDDAKVIERAAEPKALTPARSSTTSATAILCTRCDIPSYDPIASMGSGRTNLLSLTRALRFGRRTPGTAHCPLFRRR